MFAQVVCSSASGGEAESGDDGLMVCFQSVHEKPVDVQYTCKLSQKSTDVAEK